MESHYLFFPPLFFPSLIKLNFSRPVSVQFLAEPNSFLFYFPSILITSSLFPLPSFPFSLSYFHTFLFFLLILFFLFLTLFHPFFISSFSSLLFFVFLLFFLFPPFLLFSTFLLFSLISPSSLSFYFCPS